MPYTATTTRDPITGRPALCFYHPSPKGNGVAVCFAFRSATTESDGALVVSVARQNGPLPAVVPTVGADASAPAVLPFDFADAIRVRLGVVQIAELSMMLGGHVPCLVHAGNDGFYFNGPDATKSMEGKRSEDPSRPGFVFGFGQTPKADPSARRYFSLRLSPAESHALLFALRAKLGALCFGE